jgi:pyrroloquinoline quinone biosynthesis protein A
VVARLPTIKVSQRHIDNKNEERIMWTKPAYTDLRIGFEVTMYFANR